MSSWWVGWGLCAKASSSHHVWILLWHALNIESQKWGILCSWGKYNWSHLWPHHLSEVDGSRESQRLSHEAWCSVRALGQAQLDIRGTAAWRAPPTDRPISRSPPDQVVTREHEDSFLVNPHTPVLKHKYDDAVHMTGTVLTVSRCASLRFGSRRVFFFFLLLRAWAMGCTGGSASLSLPATEQGLLCESSFCLLRRLPKPNTSALPQPSHNCSMTPVCKGWWSLSEQLFWSWLCCNCV